MACRSIGPLRIIRAATVWVWVWAAEFGKHIKWQLNNMFRCLQDLLQPQTAQSYVVKDTTDNVTFSASAATGPAHFTIVRDTLHGFEWPLGNEADRAATESSSSSTWKVNIPILLYMPVKLNGSQSSTLPGSTDAGGSGAASGRGIPLVVFTPGFLVDPSAHASLCEALAGSGTPAVIYSKPDESPTQPMDDLSSERLLRAVMDWCEGQADIAAWRQERAKLQAETTLAGARSVCSRLQPTVPIHAAGWLAWCCLTLWMGPMTLWKVHGRSKLIAGHKG
jgi:hypothetical protein